MLLIQVRTISRTESFAYSSKHPEIILDPHLIDALWYRHMIRLKEDNPSEALDNLDVILELSPDHLGAWRAKAKLAQGLGI